MLQQPPWSLFPGMVHSLSSVSMCSMKERGKDGKEDIRKKQNPPFLVGFSIKLEI